MRFLHGIWIWLIAAVLVFFALPIVPMALRWPARIFVPVALTLCLAMLIRRTISIDQPKRTKFFVLRFLAISAICLAAIFAYPQAALRGLQLTGKRPVGYSKNLVAHATELKRELDGRKIELTLIAMPYSGSFFSGGKRHDALSADLEANLVHRTMEELLKAGIRCVDLFDLFEEHASNPEAWKPDFFHLQNDTVEAITPQLIERLEANGVTPDPAEEGKPVLMGECFANRFGSQIRKLDSDWKSLSVLFAQGGAERVSNNLFLFQDEYLENTSHVIWLVPYEILASTAVPPLETDPKVGSNEIKSARLKVVTCLGWGYDRSEYEDRLKRMPYPDALVEVVCKVIESGDVEKGKEIILYGFGIEDRQPLPLSHLKVGQILTANLIPFEAHTVKNPKLSRAFIINNNAPFDLERYWIHSWTHIR